MSVIAWHVRSLRRLTATVGVEEASGGVRDIGCGKQVPTPLARSSHSSSGRGHMFRISRTSLRTRRRPRRQPRKLRQTEQAEQVRSTTQAI